MTRILVTGNLHGHLDEFKSLLQEVNYNSENDILITLGNYLNYGNKQIEMIDFLIELEKKGAIVLCGNHEEYYIDALINSDFTAEQKITKSKNVFYQYLDNPEIRNKHMKFLVSLKDSHTIDNNFFSSSKEIINGYMNYYCIDDLTCIEDFIQEESSMGINFYNSSIGIVDITNRKVTKILI